jgi:CubicO group peptidase (beta-lactamase class C family)
MDLRIADLDSVRTLTTLPWFSAMIVIRGPHILFERYAPDFGRDRPHSIQSITKTTINLIVGQLVGRGLLDLSRKVRDYIPEIHSGYSEATLQQVLNMDVANDYTQDFSDPQCTYYRHEEAMGWRLPRESGPEKNQRQFVSSITSCDVTNRSGYVDYKDANTDVSGWTAERASGRPLRAFLADVADAAGLEGVLHVTTDRDGNPWLAGGACLTARDLARYFSIFARRGLGVDGREIGNTDFIEKTLASGVPMRGPYDGMRYSNHLIVRDRQVMHSGWGGQYAVANIDNGTVGVFLSVLEDQYAVTPGYIGRVIDMFDTIVQMEP